MTYTLAGVACLGPRTDGPAFLVPFFRCRTSNHHFAQDLDPERRIVAFLQFNPFQYRTVVEGLPAYDRHVGDPGLMAVRLANEVFVAEAAHVMVHISRLSFKDQNAPFFEIDAYLLTERRHDLPDAVGRAARALGGDAAANTWARAEMRTLNRAFRRDDNQMRDEYRDLSANLMGRHWVQRWLALWKLYPDPNSLIELGIRYVTDPRPRIAPKGRVVRHLVSSRQPSQTTAVQRAAMEWLNAAVEITPTDAAIAKVWLALADAGVPLQDEMFECGMRFVQAAVWTDNPPSRWPSVWGRLWKVAKQVRSSDIDHLLHIAHRGLWEKSDVPRAARLAVGALKPVANEAAVQDILYRWVCSNRPHSNAWIDAYLQIAAVRMTDELAESAADWLQTEPGRLKRWADVFASLISERPTDTELLEIGNAWLKRGDLALTTWSRVAQFVFPQGTDPEAERRVNQWIASHPENPAAWALSLKIADFEERRRLHQQI